MGQLVPGEGGEDDQVVEPVEELRLERGAYDVQHPLLLHLGPGQGVDQELTAQVRREDQDGVAEVHRPALTVGEPAVVEHLEQDVEDLGVGLLDLVQQHDAVRAAAHRLRELAALLVADVAGRGTDEPGDAVLLAVLAHVDADHGPLVVEEEVRERLGQLRLADPGRAEEEERAGGPVGVGDPGAGAAYGVRHGPDGLALPDQPPAQLGLHAQELLRLALQQASGRDAGPRADDVGDVVRADLLLDHGVDGGLLLGLVRLGQLALQSGDLAVEQLGRGVEVSVALGTLGLAAQFVEAFLQLADAVQALLLLLPAGGQTAQLLLLVGEVAADLLEPLLGALVGLVPERQLLHVQPVHGALELVDLQGRGVDLHAEPGGRLVDEVDRLVGEEAGGDVAVREGRGGHQRGVGDLDLVVCLVAALEATQDRDGVLDGRLGHQDLLEAAFQGGVLLDALAVLVERGGADHPQLTAGEHRLQHVAGVHRGVAARARADDRVQLVDEGDDLPVALLDLGEDGLQAFLELAAVLGTRDHRAQVQGDEPLVPQGLGDVALDDALGEPLDHGRLADAGLTDEHGVVLRAARQHLHDPADLLVTADDRVELALAGGRGEVGAELLQRLVLAFGVGSGHPAPSPALLECVQQLLRAGSLPVEDLTGAAALRRDGDEQVLGGEVVVTELLGAPVGVGEDGEQLAAGLRRRDGRPGDAGQRAEEPLGLLAHDHLVGLDGGQQIGDVGVVLAREQRQQQVPGGQVRVSVLDGPCGGRVEGVPALVGQLGVHGRCLLLVRGASRNFDSNNGYKVESIPLKAARAPPRAAHAHSL